MINLGYLQQSQGEYTLLQLTPKSRAIVYEGEKIQLPIVSSKKEARITRAEKTSDRPGDYDKDLFDILRAVRLELATSLKLPPYIIFPDSTLAELSTYFPQSKEELAAISGFGQVKLEKYGDVFLSAVIKYCKLKGIVSKMSDKKPKANSAPVRKTEKTNSTKLETLAFYQKGKSIENIAEERKLASSTIAAHLTHFVLTGELNVLKFITKEKLKVVEEAIGEHGAESAGLIKLKLGDNFSYMEINAAINYHLRNQTIKE